MSGEKQRDRLAPGFHSPEVLHRGTASTVYRARRDGDDTPVALKVMRDDAGAAEVDRMVELAGVPGLVHVVGGGRTSSGRSFVAMELHPGDYASALEDGGPLPLGEVLAVGRAVAGALDALHGRGLLHHRIEPGNILRAPEGAVLADMGGVTPVEGRPAPVGLDPLAVAYASPEALSGQHPLTPASDVYRLATVLWALLAGYPPFARGPGAIGDPFTYRERALSENPPRLPRADLPVRLRAVLDRALSREPGRRQDAAEFARDLAPGEAPAGALEPVPGANDAWGVPGAAPGLDGRAVDAWRAPDAARDPVGSGSSGPGVTPDAANPWGVPGAVPGPGQGAGPRFAPGGGVSDQRVSGAAHRRESGPGRAGASPEPVREPANPRAPGPGQGIEGERSIPGDGGSGSRTPEQGSSETAAAPGTNGWGALGGAEASAEPGVSDAGGVPGAAEPQGAGESGGNAPASAAGILADHPETAWAALPGWAGTATPERPATDPGPPDQAPTPPEPPQPPEGRPQGPSTRRPLFIGVTVVAIAFVAITLGAVAILRPGAGSDLLGQLRPETVASPEPQVEKAGPSDEPVPTAGLVEDSAPGDVTLEDAGHTVTVSWTDHTDPAAAHQVIGGPEGETPGNLADAEPGSASARVSGLEPGREYCFVVIAVLSVDEIAPSEQVCTERGTAS